MPTRRINMLAYKSQVYKYRHLKYPTCDPVLARGWLFRDSEKKGMTFKRDHTQFNNEFILLLRQIMQTGGFITMEALS